MLESAPQAPAPEEERAPTAEAPRPARQSNRDSGTALQAKLVVGSADDPAEREADAVADSVTRFLAQSRPAPLAASTFEGSTRVEIRGEHAQRGLDHDRAPHRPATGPRVTPKSTSGLEDDAALGTHLAPIEATPLSRIRRFRTADTPGGDAIDHDTERQIESLRSSGRPLDPTTRSEMESAMGSDFSAIRVHVGARSDQLNHRIQAKAFTTGQDVFISRAHYAPTTSAGRSLIAHELTHTIQQGAAPAIRRSTKPNLPEPSLLTRKYVQRTEEEDAKRAAFEETDVFSVTDFTPSTGSGHFNLTYTRETSELEVKVKLNLDMLGHARDNPDQSKSWTPETADAWVAKAQSAISQQWNDKFDFLLEREEWPTYRLAPRFVIEVGYTLHEDFSKGRQVDGDQPAQGERVPVPGRGGSAAIGAGTQQTTNAHYNVDLYSAGQRDWQDARDEIGFGDAKERQALAGGGADAHVVNDALQNPEAYRQAGCATFHANDADFMQHNQGFIEQIGVSERSFLNQLLGPDGLTVNFSKSLEIGERSRARLQEFAQRLSKVYPPPALRYPLLLNGPKWQCQKVQTFLEGLGVVNRFVVDRHIFANGVTVTADPDYVPSAADDVGSQVTIAHEFGHMLGLADEYNSTTPESKQIVQQSPGMDPTTLDALTSKGGGQPKFPNQQSGEMELAQEAGVPSPNNFGMSTNSIMNRGDLLLPVHMTTVWEALCLATEYYIDPSWWKIVEHQ